MIHNLVPEFLAALDTADRDAAYQAYLQRHRPLLEQYWHNYVLDLDSAPAREVIARCLDADRRDLLKLLERVDVERVAAEALATAEAVVATDVPVDLYLTVGVGGANAGELVVQGRGAVIVCLEHFTGYPNPDTYGLGLPIEQLGLWIAHEVAHLVRYLSSGSRSSLRRLIADAGGAYDCWDLASRASLRELLINEGLAVHAARHAAPGYADEIYFGYRRSEFRRLREGEAFLMRAALPDLDAAALGLRLRWLTGGMTPTARLVGGRVLPERAGYYLGARMTEALVQQRGVAEAVRCEAAEFADMDTAAQQDRALGA